MCDRNDAVTTDEPERGFDADDAIDTCRTDNRSIRFRTDSDGRQVRGNRNCRAARGPAGVSQEIIRILRLPAQAAPATRGVLGPEIGPFAEVRFAENDSAGLAHCLDKKRVVRRPMPGKRQGAGRCRHLVTCIDVRFKHDRDAMQWPARAGLLPLSIQRIGDVEGVRIQLDNGVERGAISICGIDLVQVILDQPPCGEIAALHQPLERADVMLVVFLRCLAAAAEDQERCRSCGGNKAFHAGTPSR